MSPRLALELDRHEFAAGDEVAGTVVVLEGGRSRRLEVFLLFRESTRDFDHDAIRIGSGALAEGALEEGRSYRFAVALPPDALPSLSSANGELFWEVDARSDQLGPDAHARERITVAARG